VAYLGFMLLLIVPESIGIKCWVCNSYSDRKCADPFDNRSYVITDCDSKDQLRDNLQGVPSTMCRKTSQKVNGIWRYIRSCGFLGEPGIGRDERYCRRRKGTNDIYIEDCLCRGKDGCNGSEKLDALYYFILGSIFIRFVSSRFLFKG